MLLQKLKIGFATTIYVTLDGVRQPAFPAEVPPPEAALGGLEGVAALESARYSFMVDLALAGGGVFETIGANSTHTLLEFREALSFM